MKDSPKLQQYKEELEHKNTFFVKTMRQYATKGRIFKSGAHIIERHKTSKLNTNLKVCVFNVGINHENAQKTQQYIKEINQKRDEALSAILKTIEEMKKAHPSIAYHMPEYLFQLPDSFYKSWIGKGVIEDTAILTDEVIKQLKTELPNIKICASKESQTTHENTYTLLEWEEIKKQTMGENGISEGAFATERERSPTPRGQKPEPNEWYEKTLEIVEQNKKDFIGLTKVGTHYKTHFPISYIFMPSEVWKVLLQEEIERRE